MVSRRASVVLITALTFIGCKDERTELQRALDDLYSNDERRLRHGLLEVQRLRSPRYPLPEGDSLPAQEGDEQLRQRLYEVLDSPSEEFSGIASRTLTSLRFGVPQKKLVECALAHPHGATRSECWWGALHAANPIDLRDLALVDWDSRPDSFMVEFIGRLGAAGIPPLREAIAQSRYVGCLSLVGALERARKKHPTLHAASFEATLPALANPSPPCRAAAVRFLEVEHHRVLLQLVAVFDPHPAVARMAQARLTGATYEDLRKPYDALVSETERERGISEQISKPPTYSLQPVGAKDAKPDGRGQPVQGCR